MGSITHRAACWRPRERGRRRVDDENNVSLALEANGAAGAPRRRQRTAAEFDRQPCLVHAITRIPLADFVSSLPVDGPHRSRVIRSNERSLLHMSFNLLAVSDEYTRHEEMASFCVTSLLHKLNFSWKNL